MPDFCNDCGKPAVGRFDIVYHKVVDGVPVPDEVSKVFRDTPLCAVDAKARGVK